MKINNTYCATCWGNCPNPDLDHKGNCPKCAYWLMQLSDPGLIIARTEGKCRGFMVGPQNGLPWNKNKGYGGHTYTLINLTTRKLEMVDDLHLLGVVPMRHKPQPTHHIAAQPPLCVCRHRDGISLNVEYLLGPDNQPIFFVDDTDVKEYLDIPDLTECAIYTEPWVKP